jgi:hypothetical protein
MMLSWESMRSAIISSLRGPSRVEQHLGFVLGTIEDIGRGVLYSFERRVGNDPSATNPGLGWREA